MIRFDDRAAVFTGAGGDFGRAFALELARRGAQGLYDEALAVRQALAKLP